MGGLNALTGIVEVSRKEFQWSSEQTHNVGGFCVFCNDSSYLRLTNGDFVMERAQNRLERKVLLRISSLLAPRAPQSLNFKIPFGYTIF